MFVFVIFVVIYLSHSSYSNELLYDAILGTNLHLTKEYTCWMIYIEWLLVEANVKTCFIPKSTQSCTITTMLIIIVIRTAKLHPIIIERMVTWNCSRISSNSQWILFTGTSYTELVVVEVRRTRSFHSFDNQFSSPIDLFVLNNAMLPSHTKIVW